MKKPKIQTRVYLFDWSICTNQPKSIYWFGLIFLFYIFEFGADQPSSVPYTNECVVVIRKECIEKK